MLRNIYKTVIKSKVHYLIIIFLAYQLMVAAFINLGQRLSPTTLNCRYSEGSLLNPVFLWSRANFDGMHFLSIAKRGYTNYQEAFFPLYPLTIKMLTGIFAGRDLVVGILVSALSLWGALWFLYKLILLDYDEKIARRTIFYLLIFPASFFLSFVYSEAMFLFFAVSSFYFARKKKWLLSGIMAGFASATRIVGIFLLPALLLEWYEQTNIANKSFKSLFTKKNLVTFLPIFLSTVGLLIYMIYLKTTSGNPFAFFQAHQNFGVGRNTEKFIPLYQVIWRYSKMIMVTKIDPLFFTVWFEFMSMIFFSMMIFLSYLKKIQKSYLLFAILAFITPTLTGTLVSMPRIVLILFPCFLCLALIENKLFRRLYPVICLIISFVAISLFVRGYFVS